MGTPLFVSTYTVAATSVTHNVGSVAELGPTAYESVQGNQPDGTDDTDRASRVVSRPGRPDQICGGKGINWSRGIKAKAAAK